MNSVGSGYIAAQSLSNPGYVKFSKGLIIQWGHEVGIMPSTSTLTFPTAFSTNQYGINITCCRNDRGSASVLNQSKTGCTLYLPDKSTYVWIAIGY